MDNLINMMREWHSAAQFAFLLIVVVLSVFIFITIFMECAKFFNVTLPVICRGWKPETKNDKNDEDKS